MATLAAFRSKEGERERRKEETLEASQVCKCWITIIKKKSSNYANLKNPTTVGLRAHGFDPVFVTLVLGLWALSRTKKEMSFKGKHKSVGMSVTQPEGR